jgi:hypothetical protein
MCVGLFFDNFKNKNPSLTQKKFLTVLHVISLILLSVDCCLCFFWETTFKTAWFDKIHAIAFFSSGTANFALLQSSRLNIFFKIYYGLFFFYPVFVLISIFIDKIFFALMLAPFALTLLLPDTYYADNQLEVREKIGGLLGTPRIALIEKYIFTEREIGIADFERNAKNFKLLTHNKDSTCFSVEIDSVKTIIRFRK